MQLIVLLSSSTSGPEGSGWEAAEGCDCLILTEAVGGMNGWATPEGCGCLISTEAGGGMNGWASCMTASSHNDRNRSEDAKGLLICILQCSECTAPCMLYWCRYTVGCSKEPPRQECLELRAARELISDEAGLLPARRRDIDHAVSSMM